ncbi:hypothetical protein [Thiohalophilus sp.]|uniref:hypothetical protein n=1 Tax=Thiohalophilus sp. TaxID=3028392 RepID=UPI002ACDBE7A|nr:hypothetical protein [Thiohalophilus sp.]MDZ7661299.1 hypothetical protein [Thiohalophilus sp.]
MSLAASPESEAGECEPFDDDCLDRQNSSIDDSSASKPFFSFLDRPQGSLSYGLNEMATAMDEFFAEERVFYDKTGSYVRLTADMVFDEVGDTRYIGDVKVKMRLPRTEEKLKLTFESDPEEQRDDLDRTLEDSPSEAARERAYYGGIQATLGDEKEWRFKPSIGVKFDKPIDIYLRLRMDRNYKTGNWLFRPSQTFYTFKEKGFGSDTKFVLDYGITDDILFRSSSFVRYTDENDYYEPSQVFSLLHSLSPRRGMAYQIGVYGITEPGWHATDYLAQIRYRQNIHSDYLFMELLPRVLYQRENDFDAEQSVTLRLEMIFE